MAPTDWKRKLWLLGLFKIPMIGFIRPRLLHLDENGCRISIRLRRRTKNHLGSMYFGALAVGADLAPGLLTFYIAEQQGLLLNFVFKSMQADFLQRAESNIVFVCEASTELKSAIERALELEERVNIPITVAALNDREEVVAQFVMEVSIRVRK